MGRWLAIVLVIIGASSYGLLSSFIKIAYDHGFEGGQISPAQMTMGTLFVWLLILFHKKSWANPFKGPWIKLGLVGIFGLALTTVFYNNALSELNASLSIILLFQFTWMTISMDCIVKRRLPRKAEGYAIVIIMLGTLFAVNIFETNWHQFNMRGLLYGLLSALTYSLFLFLTGQVKSSLPPLMNSAVMLTASIPVIYVLYPPTVFFDSNGGILLLWGLLLGFLGQVVPTISFNIGIPRIGSTLAAMLGSVELPVAVVAAFLLIGEAVNGVQWLGMGLILAGIIISEYKTGTTT
ncbi:DMT family transporter [Paenibacillus sp. SYP-B3998]|uniref:DMT family transporter n=1 Tax=Paenibacillus sp. SYP-B3998 TaxID=2678564 RepID=A0A6G4A3I7_9BACL|nr:DMT family transporter [Paenibacillus sp. SYP-B3998]NEW09033.1 DMT family transporter [Paenibacillus sp. SYP-B3998]